MPDKRVGSTTLTTAGSRDQVRWEEMRTHLRVAPPEPLMGVADIDSEIFGGTVVDISVVGVSISFAGMDTAVLRRLGAAVRLYLPIDRLLIVDSWIYRVTASRVVFLFLGLDKETRASLKRYVSSCMAEEDGPIAA